jgi:hypothetical protein
MNVAAVLTAFRLSASFCHRLVKVISSTIILPCHTRYSAIVLSYAVMLSVVLSTHRLLKRAITGSGSYIGSSGTGNAGSCSANAATTPTLSALSFPTAPSHPHCALSVPTVSPHPTVPPLSPLCHLNPLCALFPHCALSPNCAPSLSPLCALSPHCALTAALTWRSPKSPLRSSCFLSPLSNTMPIWLTFDRRWLRVSFCLARLRALGAALGASVDALAGWLPFGVSRF